MCLFRQRHVERSRCKQCTRFAGKEEKEAQSPSPVEEGEEASDQERAENAAENLRTEGEKEPGMPVLSGSAHSSPDWGEAGSVSPNLIFAA